MDNLGAALANGLSYFLTFKPYVMLPVIIFIVSLVFGIKWSSAVKSALQLGIAFIGIFMVFDYFVALIKPVTEALIARSGLAMNVLDVGWPPLAAITWSFSLAPVLLIAFLVINMLMLYFRLTRTVNIDIWNFWHVIFVASLVYFITDNYWMAALVSLACFVLTLKLAEWSAPMITTYCGMDSVSVPHLSAITHFPLARLGVSVLSRIPFIRSVRADPEHIKTKLGILGEPMILGLFLGAALAFGGGYTVKGMLEMAFGFAAVILILPIMGGVLGSALLPVSEGMKEFLEKRLPGRGTTYIGLDVAILFGVPATIVSAVIMIPISIGLAFVLPGVRFIPLGDLTNLMVPMSIICAATRGNIVHSVIIGIPVVIGNLYLASTLAPMLTEMAARANYTVAGGEEFTSFLDGGQLFRGWLVELFSGNLVALALIPLVLFLIWYAWRDARQMLQN